ncbi:MAG: hemolysin family protein [Candidatus Limnocylindrales bacterium]
MSAEFLEILLIGLLIVLNGMFVAAEIALVTVRRSRLQALIDEGSRGARRVQRLVNRPGRFLAVIQLGITFIGFLAAAFAGASTADRLSDFLILRFAFAAAEAEVVSLVFVTLALSLVTIVFGELVPKTLALAHNERYAMLFAGPVELLGRVFAPVVWVLNAITDAVTRLLGVREGMAHERLTTEELMILVERGGEQGVIEAEEEQMIGAVLELGERRVHEVMVPRIDIVAAPVDASLDAVVDLIVREGHSRVPLYEGTVDGIVGILYAKDLLPYLKGPDQPPDLRALMREPLIVPESRSVDDLLHDFQRGKVHLAIVLDEYGGTAGLVTIEDVIEEIVGEIQDEYDVEEPMILALSEDEARVDGRMSVDDLVDHFDVKLNGADSEEYDTVGGLVYHEIGGVPLVGDVVELDGLTLTVETTDGRRVGKVLAVRRRQRESEHASVSDGG